MDRIKMGFLLLLVLALAAPVSAQFYRYTDESGNVRYTDDLSQIPEDQRKKVPGYYESQGQETQTAPEPEPEAAGPDVSGIESEDELEQASQELQAMKTELQQEYDALVKTQEELMPDKAVTQSQAVAKKYKQDRARLEEQVRQYEKKREAYEQAVKAYNDKVREMMARDREQPEEE